MPSQLLIATQNLNKVKEITEMLVGSGDITCLSLADVGLGEMDVPETGSTFEENARLKAEAYCQKAGLPTLADDSGLMVDALGGAPGVFSARYGAPEVTTDEGRYQLLLQKLAGIPPAQRTARFECVVAIAVPNEGVECVAGSVEGYIAEAPRGDNGFGYDPIFLMPDGRTLAEYASVEKNLISHRGRAVQAAIPLIRRAVGSG